MGRLQLLAESDVVDDRVGVSGLPGPPRAIARPMNAADVVEWALGSLWESARTCFSPGGLDPALTLRTISAERKVDRGH